MINEFIHKFDSGESFSNDYLTFFINEMQIKASKGHSGVSVENIRLGNPSIIIGYRGRYFAIPYDASCVDTSANGPMYSYYYYEPYEVVRFMKTVWDYYPKDKIRNSQGN